MCICRLPSSTVYRQQKNLKSQEILSHIAALAILTCKYCIGRADQCPGLEKHDRFVKVENIDLIDKQHCELISDDFRREQ